MNQDYSSETDIKSRWGGLFENPYISKIQRNLLDGFKVTGLSHAVQDLDYQSMLDIGCGWGEYTKINKDFYVGVDNSLARAAYASHRYQSCHFSLADAARLPFADHSFDAVFLISTIHHLSDKMFYDGLREMERISRHYLVIDDVVVYPNQNFVSRFFYDLDRGQYIRSSEQIENMLSKVSGFNLVKKCFYRTFPGLYLHEVFVLERP